MRVLHPTCLVRLGCEALPPYRQLPRDPRGYVSVLVGGFLLGDSAARFERDAR